MRKIKFRAWDKTRKCFVTANALWITGQMGIEGKWPDIEIMQFTGLLDRNGKEIYEGDIVHFRESPKVIGCEEREAVEMKAMVQWSSEGADFEMVGDYFGNNLIRGFNGSQGIEVIGNIHESPE